MIILQILFYILLIIFGLVLLFFFIMFNWAIIEWCKGTFDDQEKFPRDDVLNGDPL